MHDSDEARERRDAELAFVRSAYDAKTEAWIIQPEDKEDRRADDDDDGGHHCEPAAVIVRRLVACNAAVDIGVDSGDDDNNDSSRSSSSFLLRLELPYGYPINASLVVDSCTVERCARKLPPRVVHAAAHALLVACRAVVVAAAVPTTTTTVDDNDDDAEDHHPFSDGEEAVFAVLQRADEWIAEEWPNFVASSQKEEVVARRNTKTNDEDIDDEWWGRNLIYSHHIIGQQKRADMKALAADLELTGYVKIGWPGIIVIEGLESHCRLFYDTIRRWAWQYLVLRGEMRERITCMVPPSQQQQQLQKQQRGGGGGGVSSSAASSMMRKFPTFLEVDSMSVVAEHCRRVGLEELFRTSMKVQANSHHSQQQLLACSDGSEEESTSSFYGALVHVDHMNDAKQYRKWLRRTCADLNVWLLIRQCFDGGGGGGGDSVMTPAAGRPRIIVVGLVGRDEASVTAVLKKWRGAKVDVDRRGLPCLERQMTVLVQGPLDAFDGSLWEETDTAAAERSDNNNSHINTTKEKLVQLIESSTQTKSWVDAIQSLLFLPSR